MRSRIQRLALTDFRSYCQASLEADGRTCFLYGPNGAGKTNLLESISFFSPGRGLRGAQTGEVGRRDAGAAEGFAWAVSAEVLAGDDIIRLGTGIEGEGGRRLARIAGEGVPVGALADYVRPLWLTPAHDRLFAGPAGDRRRFLDRLVFSAVPGHAAEVSGYEHALRERQRLLTEGGADRAWLEALEARAAGAGARVALARAQTVRDLSAEIDARSDGPFPGADLELTGEWNDAEGTGEVEARLSRALALSRPRDMAAGRALAGPHRTDFALVSRASGRAAADCSTGEQKALILNLILAQAARLSRAISQANPILLLDEVAAHLDAQRRAALFDEIEALSLQAFLTGTDETLFESLKGRALGVRVEASSLTLLDK